MVTQPVISTKHFDAALLKARTTFSQSIGSPSIPTVLWEDVGGLGPVKDEILDTVQLPLDHPELFQEGLKKRSGYLSLLGMSFLLTMNFFFQVFCYMVLQALGKLYLQKQWQLPVH